VKSNDPYLVYILRCADNTLYTGITNGLEKRLRAHTEGTGAKYVRTRLPYELVYTEELATKSLALKREIAIKKLTRTEKLALLRVKD
jgi:putative endonuclease